MVLVMYPPSFNRQPTPAMHPLQQISTRCVLLLVAAGLVLLHTFEMFRTPALCCGKKDQHIAADNMLVLNHEYNFTADDVQALNWGSYHMPNMSTNKLVLIRDNLLFSPDMDQSVVNVSMASNRILFGRDLKCISLVNSPIILSPCPIAELSINNLHSRITQAGTQYFGFIQETDMLNYVTKTSQTKGMHFASWDRPVIESWITKMFLLHYRRTRLLCCFIKAQLARSLFYRHDYQCYLGLIDHRLHPTKHEQSNMGFTIQLINGSARVIKWILDTVISDVIQLGAHILNDHEITCPASDSTSKSRKTVKRKTIRGRPVSVYSRSRGSLEKYMLSETSIDNCMFDFVAHVPMDKSISVVEENPNYAVADVPLSILVRYLTRSEMRQIAAIHGIVLSEKLNCAEIMDIVGQHTSCKACNLYLSVFLCKHQLEFPSEQKKTNYKAQQKFQQNKHPFNHNSQTKPLSKKKRKVYSHCRQPKQKNTGFGQAISGAPETASIHSSPTSHHSINTNEIQHEAIGGGRRGIGRFSGEYLKKYLLAQKNVDNSILEFVAYMPLEKAKLMAKDNSDYLLGDVPIYLLSEILTKLEMSQIAAIHGFWFPVKLNHAERIEVIKQHTSCENCKSHISVFLHKSQLETTFKKKEQNRFYQQKFKEKRKSFKPIGSDDVKPAKFPPEPASQKLQEKIISEFCNDTSPAAFEEAGCAVCGELIPLTRLKLLKDAACDMTVLYNSDVTRKERKTADSKIEELDGPVIDTTCDHICDICQNSLNKGKRPINSLSNGLWIGEIPTELEGLTFAERILIARVRHNKCLVCVSSGRAKMTANAIMFSNPTLKVYKKLPPSQEELDEVLAFIFTGVAQPTEDDFKRTPMLVRRNKVALALEWLKLNHVDYTDLEISEENLQSYPLEGVPVVVDYKKTSSDSNKIVTAMSMHDNEEEEGTTEGSCPFTVHGLTGAEYETLTIQAIKARALQHLDSEGRTLGIGHSESPESLYDNPQAYPQMFPWLFPYGLGGIGQAQHKGKYSEINHKRHLLMYHDKRFQTDIYFPIIAFNHSQMKSGITGSFLLAKRRQFPEITQRLMQINPSVLMDISQRMAAGEIVRPESDEEKLCFSLIDDLDHVGGHVSGSLTSKKYMRNEIWSLISFMGAPSWFITLSPADNRHPIALYFADKDIHFRPEIRCSDERNRLVAQNPVAAARFFDFMVKMFIKHVLGIEGDHPGLYGNTSAYYGTVEQQGRLTLHMHMLLWIEGALSPQEIRNRLMSHDEMFQKELIAYLEGSQVGEFLTGTMSDVKAKVPIEPSRKKGIHAIIPNPDKGPTVQHRYQDPTLTLPQKPPPECTSNKCGTCYQCIALQTWEDKFQETVDDLVLRSNVHTCTPMTNPKTQKKIKSKNKMKAYDGPKGCLNEDGECNARFPRDIVPESVVDKSDGYIRLKKLESMINTITPAITYLFRCNTDVTSLTSGTSIKAIVYYITNYVTKQSLKTHQLFSSAYDIFESNPNFFNGLEKPKDAARKLILKIVNALSSKLEIGSPMASLYLLGNPDHYTSHQFTIFWWKRFVSEVQNDWKEGNPSANDNSNYPEEKDKKNSSDHKKETAPTDVEHDTKLWASDNLNFMDEDVGITREKGTYIATSIVDDYKYRPPALEHISLYEWIQCATRKRKTKKEIDMEKEQSDESKINIDHMDDDDDSSDERILDDDIDCSGWYSFQSCHPLYATHKIQFSPNKCRYIVPNFVGGPLPRCDQGDREYYCCTMLTFFKPWRTGKDLKSAEQTWDDCFEAYPFTERQQNLLKIFNLKYECLDARDDYFAQMKAKKKKPSSDTRWMGDIDDDNNDIHGTHFGLDEELTMLDFDEIGPKSSRHRIYMNEAEQIMRTAGWMDKCQDMLPNLNVSQFTPLHRDTAATWKNTIKQLRAQLISQKTSNLPMQQDPDMNNKFPNKPNEVKVVDADYIRKDFKTRKEDAQKIIDSTVQRFSLNTEQERAFRIIANHAASTLPPQLKMYLGGMGGTGKSLVIKALAYMFNARNENYRFAILAPTGTAAALLNGSTYHYMLGIRIGRESQSASSSNIATIAEVRARLQGVEYIFIDEISMVSCNELYSISARLAEVRNVHDVPFGGLNTILAGDFAQLPPTGGSALYSQNISDKQSGRMTVRAQETFLGKLLWHQITTVVILQQNMRQKTQSRDDEKLRTALSNMRYGACTTEDILFLKSRVAGKAEGRPKLNNSQFRNVSVITAWNSQKDKLNEMGCHRFAADTNQKLTTFYSIDSVANASDEKSYQKSKKALKKSGIRSMTPDLQTALWNLPPSSTEHVAGKLSLCIGMPVMIRNNDATELCITKGQEATVVGWDAITGPFGQQVLENLFLKLDNPPQTIKIEGLPENVIPMSRTTTTINCTLLNDTNIKISRQQILVLPNFAMTDYAAQGKTRKNNVVDLGRSKTHLSYYTCLSRSASADGTVIVQGFDAKKITSGISGYLRQEFRELNLLDEITTLRYGNMLPPEISAELRNPLIRSYQLWKKNDASHSWHPALKWNPDEPWMLEPQENGLWSLTTKNVHKNTVKNTKKRKLPKQEDEDPAMKSQSDLKHIQKKGKTLQQHIPSSGHGPIGFIWNGTNWSCAYDTVFTILLHIWMSSPVQWTNTFSDTHVFLQVLARKFHLLMQGNEVMEQARNDMHQLLHEHSPNMFPMGQNGAAVMDVLSTILNETACGSIKLGCNSCSHEIENWQTIKNVMHIEHLFSGLNIRIENVLGLNSQYHMNDNCPLCGNNATYRLANLTSIPSIWAFGIYSSTFKIQYNLRVTVQNTSRILKLRGIIYLGQFHFTCRLFGQDESIWYHDGQITGRSSVFQSYIQDVGDMNTLLHVNNGDWRKAAVTAIYA